MTHNTDCTVLEEAREDVDRVAHEYLDGSNHEAERIARDLGWERVGGGMGREVWEVPSEEQTGSVDAVVEEMPCVVKFATSRHVFPGGLAQNRDELEDYLENFPPELTEGDPPLIVPVTDWAAGEPAWITMPKADSSRAAGSKFDVEEQLKRAGWKCDDIHSNNVGEMHGHTVLFDYGGECYEEPAIEAGEEYADAIDDMRDAEVTGVEEFDDHVSVYFVLPTWLGGGTDPPPDESVLNVGFDGPQWATLRFGTWDPEMEDFAVNVAERAARELMDLWPSTRINHDVELVGDDLAIVFDVNIMAEDWPAHVLTQFIGEVGQEVDDRMMGVDPRIYLEDLQREMESRFGVDGEVEFEGSAARLLWTDNTHGNPRSKSWVAADPGGTFGGMRIALGPWGEDSADDVTTAASDTVDRVDGMWFEDPEMEITWRKIHRPGQRGNDRFELAFFVDPADISTEAAADMYGSFIETFSEELRTAVAAD